MLEIWCLGSDGVTHEVHPTAQIDVVAENFGEFTTQYLSGSGCIIPVIGQISINRSVKILGIPADAWGYGLLFIDNFQAQYNPTGWGHGGTSNHNWGVNPGEAYSNAAVAWGSTLPALPA